MKVHILEVINEVFFMGVIYHMVYLTAIVETWGLSGMMQYKIGNSLLKMLYVQMGINVVFALYMVLLQTLSERRKRANQK
jgi:low affinity Fe/Cu permease